VVRKFGGAVGVQLQLLASSCHQPLYLGMVRPAIMEQITQAPDEIIVFLMPDLGRLLYQRPVEILSGRVALPHKATSNSDVIGVAVRIAFSLTQ